MLRPSLDVITHQEHFGAAAQTIPDPEVIDECRKLKRALLTADSELPFTYAAELRKAKIAVFVLSNNHDGPAAWGPRILSAALDMERELAVTAKPFCAHVNTEGRISYVLRYYRKKTKLTNVNKSRHLAVDYSAPTAASSSTSSSIEPVQPASQSPSDLPPIAS